MNERNQFANPLSSSYVLGLETSNYLIQAWSQMGMVATSQPLSARSATEGALILV